MIAWLLGTRLGRWLAIAGAAALALGVALLRAFQLGKASERAKHDRQSLENLRNRSRVDDEVARMSDADRRKRLGRWVSDGGE